jgi:hypothetical protein
LLEQLLRATGFALWQQMKLNAERPVLDSLQRGVDLAQLRELAPAYVHAARR